VSRASRSRSACSFPASSPLTAYNRGCQCDRCRAATSARQRDFRARHPERVKLYGRDSSNKLPPMPRQVRPLKERVLARVVVDENGCWIWQGARTRWGSGMVRNGPGLRPRAVVVHEVMWEEVHGPIGDWQRVEHRCGVNLCCNPAHLGVTTSNNGRRARRVTASRGS
jgi:HNH endonuclease